MANLTTRGTGLSSPESVFSMTKFLALTTQWVRYVHCNRNAKVANSNILWNDWSFECNNERIGVPPAARVIFRCNVKNVFHPLGFQLSQTFLLITADKRATPDDSLAGIESPVRAGCNRTDSQVVQLVDYSTLNSRCNLQKEVTMYRGGSFASTHWLEDGEVR